MKKKVLLAVMVVALLLGVALGSSAQVRLDIDLNWPIVGGIALDPAVFGSSGGNLDLSQYHLLLPDLRLYYQFGDGVLRGGLGLRIYTVIIESLLFPEAYLEVNLKPFVIGVSAGGFLFGVIGLYSNLGTAGLLLPDINAYWAIADWFRIGAGALLFVPTSFGSSFGYIGYIGARFVFVFNQGGKSEPTPGGTGLH
jgi:hypothetical protein